MAIFSVKDRVLTEKFVRAELIRNEKVTSHLELKNLKVRPILHMQKNSYLISSLEYSLQKLHDLYITKSSIKRIKDHSRKIKNSVSLHRKVFSQISQQESKILRKKKLTALGKNPDYGINFSICNTEAVEILAKRSQTESTSPDPQKKIFFNIKYKIPQPLLSRSPNFTKKF